MLPRLLVLATLLLAAPTALGIGGPTSVDADGDAVPDALEPFICDNRIFRSVNHDTEGALGRCERYVDYVPPETLP